MSVTRSHRNLLLAAAGAMTILIAMGGIVCATNASGGCPDWPRCHGRLVPPLETSSILEYGHRAVAGVTLILVALAAAAGWKRGGALRWLPLITLALMVVVALFGRAAVLTGLTPPLAAIDLGSALVAMALIVSAAVIADARANPEGRDERTGSRLRFAAPAALLGFFAVVVTGVLVAQGTVMRCVGGPLQMGGWTALGAPSLLTTPRQIAGLAVAILAIIVVVLASKADVGTTTRRWSLVFAGAFVLECVLNAAMLATGPAAPLLLGSVAATALAWAALVIVTVRSTVGAPALSSRPVQ